MLDTDTKRRIDTARDILVGKLPDPKSQVEQITIALIYKFMDDMDKQSEELGGKAKFFTGEYGKYSWSKIFDPSISGHELVGLYGEAIQRMNQNPNIPQLFRDIFKNAYLPYRDPETLKSFLKTINEFHYEHSEKLGDAFEYLLSIMGSQGDAGQFRTPRHIIDFIVNVVAPKKDESVLDPACGTAGFLISAYKYILKTNSSNFNDEKVDLVKKGEDALKSVINGNGFKGDLLTPDEKKRLVDNFVGYDISPDMVRLSLVNMYLHGFSNPKIYEYDTLTSEEKWNEVFDVILANPPFMTPKGGIRPHKRFSIQANRSEVLFVDYMHEHLNPNGRAGIIVPEGIIFQSASAYKALRKMLLEHSLYGVVSLPAGVFNPYSGVKTSILLLDKNLVKKTKNFLFVKVNNDGFNLGAQRREVKENDLPIALEIIKKFQKGIRDGKDCELNKVEQRFAHVISKEDIADDYSLSGDGYKEQEVYSGKHELVELGGVCEVITDKPLRFDGTKKYYSTGSVDIGSASGFDLVTYENRPSRANIYPKLDDVGFAVMKGTNKVIYVNEKYEGSIFSTGFSFLRANQQILPKYLFKLITDSKFQSIKDKLAVDGIMGGIRKSDILKIKIPLPPLEIQEQIVSELESYQNIVDGAKKVVESYKPSFKIDPGWEVIELGEISENLDEKRIPITKSDRKSGKYPYYGASGIVDYVDSFIFDEDLLLISEDGANLRARVTPIAFSVSGKIWVNNHAHVLRFKDKATQIIVEHYLNSIHLDNYITGSAQPKINQGTLNKIKIPLPPLSIQKQIVAQIEEEQKLVNSNMRLIELFEKKIADKIAEVWEKMKIIADKNGHPK